MDHEEAIRTHAVERYSLGDITPEERDAFEQHYFECRDCWAAVRRAEMFAQNARVLRRARGATDDGNIRPFRPAMKWAAVAAAAVLTLLALGPLQSWLGSLPRQGEIPHLYVAEAMRGANDGANVLPGGQWVTLLVDVLPVDGAPSYRLTLRGAGDVRHLDVTQEKAKNTVQWLLRPLPAGSYELVVESVDAGGGRSEIARHSIRVGGS